MITTEIIVVGAGAAGLMAARELGRAGKKVVILEARDRVGGRIMPLEEDNFGYPAQAGAEWVHGEAPITRELIKEAGLTLIPEEGEIWSARSGRLEKMESFNDDNPELKKALEALTADLPLKEFLDKNFSGEEHADFRNSLIKMAEGYDAADVNLVSTLALKEDWLANSNWQNGRIKEGYTGLLNFLESECKKYGVEIVLNTQVAEVDALDSKVSIKTTEGKAFGAEKVMVTVPLPILKEIIFNPELKEKQDLVSEIGWGYAVKVLIKFKTRWWESVSGRDLSKMAFLLCNERFLTWWSQYPVINTTLTGWIAGPEALNYKDMPEEKIVDLALQSLAKVCEVSVYDLKREVELYKVANWPADPFTKGAYSFSSYKVGDACKELAEPYDNAIYFAGEALCESGAIASVEGALESGLTTAQNILR